MSTTLLATIRNHFIIYAGSILFSLGFTGTLLTIYIIRSTRQSPITFISIILCIANSISLIVGLLNRVIVAIVGTDPIFISPVWCKLRVYVGQTSVLFCQSCACLASINCFLLTSRQVHRRRLVNLRICRLCIVVTAVFWIIHGLFNPLLTELIIISRKSSSCSLVSSIATNYAVFFPSSYLNSSFPICILSVFAILTHRNLSQLKHRRSFEQQPMCYAYQSSTGLFQTKSSLVVAQENFALNFINIIFYTPQASPFYIYYFALKVFKK